MNPLKEIHNIIIFGHSSIGDVCYNLANVSALCSHFPKAKISFLTSLRVKNLVEGYPGIDTLIIYDRKYRDRGIRKRIALMRRLASQKFDLAVALKKTWMSRFLGIPCRWELERFQQSQQPNAQPTHILDTYLEFLRFHGVNGHQAIFNFRFSKEDNQAVDAFLKEHRINSDTPLVAILPAAAWSLKSWPIERWNELAQTLRARYGIRTISVGKQGDNTIDKAVSQRLDPEILWADKTTLKQAMALIQRCQLFIGPDSSLLHLASCMGVETIGLYGPTSPETFYPYFHRHNILKTSEKLECMPCYPHFRKFPCGEDTDRLYGSCTERLPVQAVLSLVENLLSTKLQEK